MVILELILPMLGLIGKIIPPLRKWLEERNGGYFVWKSEITYWAGRPRSASDKFFGRATDQKAIGDAFKMGNCVVLSGSPGVGKSQLAAEFAKESKRKGFWTPGGVTPNQTLIALAPHLGIERGERSDDEILLQTRRRLQGLPAKTLWVIDNLPDLDQLNTLLAETGNFSLLVTTQDGRDNAVAGEVKYQPIGVLDPESAVRLLSRSGRYDLKHPMFSEIVEEVGRLPRAVEALSVQINLPGETPERLLEELRELPNPLELSRFQYQTAGLQIPRPESLFNALRGPVVALSDDVREALAPLGYTADMPIPISLAESLTGVTGGAVIGFFDECASKSILSKVGDQVRLHSLTAAVIASTNPIGSIQITLQRVIPRLAAVVGTHDLVPVVDIAHYERMLSQSRSEIHQDDEVLLRFSNNLAAAFLYSGRYREACLLHEANLEAWERTFGQEHRDVLSSKNNLASAYTNTGRYREALDLLQSTFSIQERVIGREDPDTLLSGSNLATVYYRLGRYEEAIELFLTTLALQVSVLGSENPNMLSTKNNLGAVYDSIGRYAEAIRLHSEVLDVRQKVLRVNHPDTLASRNNLAAAYNGAGSYEEAARLLLGNWEARQQILGPEHPDTLGSLNNLAACYDKLGHYDEAVRLHEKNSIALAQTLGPEDIRTLSSRNNLGNSLRNAGRIDEAEVILQEALLVMEKVQGREHPDTLVLRKNLALTYSALGRVEEARTLMESG